MDHFILNNNTWLKYLPIAVYVLLVIIITLLILIGFMLYKRYKYQNLKSRNHKSVFATAYAECSVQNASSSVPLKTRTGKSFYTCAETGNADSRPTKAGGNTKGVGILFSI